VLTRDLPRDVAQHLVHTYGTSSLRVVEVGEQNEKKRVTGTNQRIHPDFPFLRSEISYSARHEMAQKPNDILCRRVPIAFLNKQVSQDLLGEVVEILGREHNWSSSKKAEELKEANENLIYLK
jgi:glycerol-3-phosphate dehydrogenase